MKLKFVSYTSNLLEQMYDYRKHIMCTLKWISNLLDLPRSRSLETVPVCIVLQSYPHSNTANIHMCDECKISIDSGRLSQALVQFVIDRASLFTDHKISGRPIRAKYKHLRTS